MSKQKISGKALVIQLSNDQIRIAKTTLGAAMPQLQGTFVANLPQGAVIDGVIHDFDAVQSMLHAALDTPELRRVKRVLFVLCTTQVISETTTMPHVPLSRLDKVLDANMDMYFPVDTHNYHLAWQLVEKPVGKSDLNIQMWAVTTSIIHPYYELANSCGLSVVAIDYCVNALAGAVEASFSVPDKKKAASALNKPLFAKKSDTSEADVPAGQAPQSDTQLYLLAEPEHLLTLFVQDGHVKMSRTYLCGPSLNDELSDVAMSLDYYDSISMGGYSSINCVLCGSLAEDEAFVQQARDILNIPVHVLPALTDSAWTLCLGAARTKLDFGLAELNHVKSATGINNAWQYGLIAVGGVALVLSVVTLLGSKTIWTTTVNGLESTKQTLQIQAAQNANYAQNYYNYQSAYQNYSRDWDSLFGSLRTYNDNLVLMINELEETLPEDTSVVGIQIAPDAMALELASPTKEEAAYTIIALRQLEYADLLGISSLVKPAYEAPPTVGSLDIGQILGQLGGLGNLGGTTSNLPALGITDLSELTKLLSAGDPAELLKTAFEKGWITDEALDNSPVVKKVLDKVMDDGKVTKEEVAAAIFALTPEELDELESSYCPAPETDYTLEELRKQATVAQRQNALSTMFNNDPIALYRFYNLFKEDMNRDVKPPKNPDPDVKYAVLDEKIYSDVITKKDDDGKTFVSKVVSGGLNNVSREDLTFFVDILTQKNNQKPKETERCITSVEDLIHEDSLLEQRYVAYLAAELKLADAPEMPIFDPKKIIANIVGDLIMNGGGTQKPNDKPDEKPGDKPGSTQIPNPYPDKIPDDVWNDLVNSGTGGTPQLPGGMDIGSILDGLLGGGGSIMPNYPQAPAQPVDDRYHFTVTLGYKDALIIAERERKGLDYNEKIAELPTEVTK